MTSTWGCSGGRRDSARAAERARIAERERVTEGERDKAFLISSDDAYVASARTRCWKCHAAIEVACIYCASGMIRGEPYEEFAVSNITAVDAALWRQLERWPFFRFGYSRAAGGRYLANHCPRCQALQGDYFLHCEPKGAFFTLKHAPRGTMEFTPLRGPVRLSGDEGFEP